MGVSGNTEPLTLDSVGQIDDEGRIRLTFFAELHERLRATVTATAEVRDAQGNLVPPPQPEPSAAQTWTKKAEGNETVADMRVFAGRADNWFDIFKTIEAAETWLAARGSCRRCLDRQAKHSSG